MKNLRKRFVFGRWRFSQPGIRTKTELPMGTQPSSNMCCKICMNPCMYAETQCCINITAPTVCVCTHFGLQLLYWTGIERIWHEAMLARCFCAVVLGDIVIRISHTHLQFLSTEFALNIVHTYSSTQWTVRCHFSAKNKWKKPLYTSHSERGGFCVEDVSKRGQMKSNCLQTPNKTICQMFNTGNRKVVSVHLYSSTQQPPL